MTTTPPESRQAPAWLLLSRTNSIELRAIVSQLSQRSGLQCTHHHVSGSPFEPARGANVLVLCDLAHAGDGEWALSCLQSSNSGSGRHVLVALGSAREVSPDVERVLELAELHLKRPIDVKKAARTLAEQVLESYGGEAPSLPPSAPTSSPELAASPPLPDLGPPRPESVQPTAPSQPPPSKHMGGAGLDQSEASPELAQLLSDAEQRVAAQLQDLPPTPVGSAPRTREGTQELGPDVWKALAEPLEDDVDHLIDDFRDEDDEPPESPLVGSPPTSNVPPPEDHGTGPPEEEDEEDWLSHVDEDTGSHAHLDEEPEPEPISAPLEQTASLLGPESEPPPSRPTVRPGGGVRLSSEFITGHPSAPPTASPNDPDLSFSGNPEIHSLSIPPTLNPESLASPPPPTVEPVPSIHTAGPASGPDERGTISPDPLDSITAARRAQTLELPDALVRGASARAIGQAVRVRFTGCLTFEVDRGLRRVVFREGDIVIAASAVHGESLVSFLTERGDIGADLAKQIEHRIPPLGRHAGAALIARGALQQGDLWPVLRAHSEWVLTHLLRIERGSVRVEHPIPERLAAEPSVFGGATGAEVLVETLQRALPPEQALQLLGHRSEKFTLGASSSLLAECALTKEMSEWVEEATRQPLQPLLARANKPMLPAVLLALCLLDVLVPHQPKSDPRDVPQSPRPAPEAVDPLDDEAVRTRVKTRRELVDDGDYFALLGVQRHATGYEIRRSYLELRRQLDPARILGPATVDLRDDIDTILEVLDEAYDILKDQQRRERYRKAIEASPTY